LKFGSEVCFRPSVAHFRWEITSDELSVGLPARLTENRECVGGQALNQ
jgi:hypothetical protein